jgi:lactoylglutathione lyase
MTSLALSYTKLMVADLDAAERFYTTALGFKVFRRNTAPDGDYAQKEICLSLSGSPAPGFLVLSQYLARAAPPPGEAWIGFDVSDMDALVEAIVAAGGSIPVPPEDCPAHGVRSAVAADYEGHVIGLNQPLR